MNRGRKKTLSTSNNNNNKNKVYHLHKYKVINTDIGPPISDGNVDVNALDAVIIVLKKNQMFRSSIYSTNVFFFKGKQGRGLEIKWCFRNFFWGEIQ